MTSRHRTGPKTLYQLLSKWSRYIARGVYFGLYRGAQGYGFPKPRAQWEAEYQTGHWDYLSGGKERPAQMVVLGYALLRHASPSVLDVGCGDGMLFDMMQHFPLAEYHGLDSSDEAIVRARRRVARNRGAGVAEVDFTRADFESYTPTRQYDVIVFNNSLMYAEDPLWLLERFANTLTHDGFIVASLCFNSWQFPIWKRIASRFTTLHSADLTNEEGLLWHVRVLERQTRAAPASEDVVNARANVAPPHRSKFRR